MKNNKQRILSVLFIIALGFWGCDNNQSNVNPVNTKVTQVSKDASTETSNTKGNELLTFFTFQENNAEEAMNYYMEAFDNSEIIEIQKHGKEGPAPEGSILFAKFTLNGREFMCSDSPIKHEWSFTPGVSIFIECESIKEQDRLFAHLSKDGQVFMPLNNYGFSERFAFVVDQFGVSWQLNLN